MKFYGNMKCMNDCKERLLPSELPFGFKWEPTFHAKHFYYLKSVMP
jgi:hypothetical protein